MSDVTRSGHVRFTSARTMDESVSRSTHVDGLLERVEGNVSA